VLVTTILLFKFRLLQEITKDLHYFFLESHKVKVNKNRGHFTVHTLSTRLESCFLAAEDETLADCEQVPEDRQREVAGRSLLLAATAAAVVIVVAAVVVAVDSGDQGFDYAESFAESVVVVAAVVVVPESVVVAAVAVVVAVAVVAVAAEPEAVVVVASAAGVLEFLDGAAE
jgi:hypothetical protein